MQQTAIILSVWLSEYVISTTILNGRIPFFSQRNFTFKFSDIVKSHGYFQISEFIYLYSVLTGRSEQYVICNTTKIIIRIIYFLSRILQRLLKSDFMLKIILKFHYANSRVRTASSILKIGNSFIGFTAFPIYCPLMSFKKLVNWNMQINSLWTLTTFQNIQTCIPFNFENKQKTPWACHFINSWATKLTIRN